MFKYIPVKLTGSDNVWYVTRNGQLVKGFDYMDYETCNDLCKALNLGAAQQP